MPSLKAWVQRPRGLIKSCRKSKRFYQRVFQEQISKALQVVGATTFSKMTISITTISKPHSKKGLFVKSSIEHAQHKCHSHWNICRVTLCCQFQFSFCYAECRSDHCHYANCHHTMCFYTECRYAECRGARYTDVYAKAYPSKLRQHCHPTH